MKRPALLRQWLPRVLANRMPARIEAIGSEASLRRFFRLRFAGGETRVAMVYPQPSRDEIEGLVRLHDVYRRHGLAVPRIREVIADQVVLEDDCGDDLIQKVFRSTGRHRRVELLTTVADILIRLRSVPRQFTSARLDRERMKKEMEFFLTHFLPYFPRLAGMKKRLRSELGDLADRIPDLNTFAHRDFHSRNLLFHEEKIFLVDYQDSLVGPDFYDLVSFAFDSYLDLGGWRPVFLERVRERGLPIDRGIMLRTALQRNIKALGTFAFQDRERGHGVYRRYVGRTLRHILGHVRELGDSRLSAAGRFFNRAAAAWPTPKNPGRRPRGAGSAVGCR